MKTCEYFYKGGMYHSECGAKSVHRPTQKCDKCGRKPQEKKNVNDS